MKKNILVLAAVCFTLVMSSQAQTKFGIRAGAQLFNTNAKDINGNKMDNTLKFGFHAGLTADIPVAPDYFIQPGLLYSRKGANHDYANSESILSYIEVPVNFIYKPSLGNGKLLLGFGPYFGVLLDAKMEHVGGDETEAEITNQIPANAPATGYYVQRTDAGANFLAGYEFSRKFSVQLNAQLGLANIAPEDLRVANDKSNGKNTGFGLSVGYKF